MKSPLSLTSQIEHLSPVATRMILAALPDKIRQAFERRAAEIELAQGSRRSFLRRSLEYPVEAVLEMALAGFLDSKCLSFTDCKPRY